MTDDPKLERKKEVDRVKVDVWSRAIRAGLAAKASYRESAAEVMGYFKMTHAGLYSSDAVSKHFCKFTGDDDEGGGMAVSVNKAALVRSVLGPHLYQQNPKREVNAKKKDAVSYALAEVIEAYLDYTVREGKLAVEVRRAIDDALLRGAGFLRTVFDEDREIITSRQVSSMRVVIDPAAHTLDEARWVAISTRLPMREVKRRWGEKEKWRIEDLKAGGTATVDQDCDAPSADDAYMQDQVVVWEVYSKDGNGLHMGPEVAGRDDFENDEDSNDFVKLTIVLDHPHPLEEGAWEVPLHLDREWPIVMLQFVETLDQLWPESVMGQALTHQKALDLFTTLELHAVKRHARDIYFYRADMLTTEDKEQLLRGRPSEAIPMGNLQPGQKPQDVLYRAELGSLDPGVGQAKMWHSEQFDLVSGAMPILQGAPNGAQDRSATATDSRRQAANSRLGDMLAKVEEFCSAASRNEAITCRIGGLVTAQQVAEAVGGLKLGFRVDAVEGRQPVRLPLRGKGLSIESFAPAAATYFETPEQAQTLLPLVWEGLVAAASSPEAPEELRAEAQALVARLALAAGGLTDEPPPGLVVRPVTAEDVYYDTKGMGPRTIVREFDFQVVSGTTQKQDPQAKREAAEMLVQQWGPVAFKAGDFNTLNAIKDFTMDAFGIPENERIPDLAPPPPPMPVPGAAPPGGVTPGEGA